MTEIVKYHNVLNQLEFKGFEERDFDVFMSICVCMRDVGGDTRTLDYDLIMDMIGWDRRQGFNEFHKVIERVSNNLRILGGSHVTADEFDTFNLFRRFKGSLKTKQLIVKVEDDFKYVLNELAGNFTQFELQEYVNLKGRYVKQLYQHLKQYKSTGWWQVSIADFRAAMSIPQSTSNENIKSKYINSAIASLKSCKGFEDLEVENITSRRRGRATIGYKFSFGKSQSIQMNATNKRKANQTQKSKIIKNSFNNFPQNEYDFDELEKLLLSN